MKALPLHTSRRRLLKTALAMAPAATGLTSLLPAFARSQATDASVSRGIPGPRTIDLGIYRETLEIAGTSTSVTAINHTIPGPLIELYEGHEARLRVTNHMDVDTSIHWHGILLPFELDGVPGVAYPGIKPGETFEAHFRVRQYGTYWYHSHSGGQEQTGVYGPLVIHPARPEPVEYDRDYIVMLSDWTFENPHHVMARLKKMGDYYNFSQPAMTDFFRAEGKSWLEIIEERLMWGAMRMNPTDIADVTAHTYTYLMNGQDMTSNWTALFQPGERVRLRFINASAMTYFNVRIPGLPMTVIQADGQYVQPVETDEFQFGVAETLDVIVEPAADRAYTLFAESMDRSGYVHGTLAPARGMSASVPELREPPRRTMVDMGMSHDMPMNDMPETPTPAPAMQHQQMGHDTMTTATMEHQGQGMDGPNTNVHTGHEMNTSGPVVARHGPDDHGPGNISVAEVQRNRLGEPGTGLEDTGHRVLVYTDLKNIMPGTDRREPSHNIELHLTGNMERYMWSFDGKQYSDAGTPIHFPYGERIRLILVNDTMMEHPIHLHGMFMELENGQGEYLPRKHTISVKPAERLSLLITADEPGRWAFHCHFLYHMDMGMFRVVEVS